MPTTDGIALGLILYFEDEAIGTLPEKDVSNVYEDKSPGGIAHICYPRKAILNALGIGLTEPSPLVDLVAGPGWIGIFPPLGLTDEIKYEL